MISGICRISDHFWQTKGMWRFTLLIFLLSTPSLAHLGAKEVSCPPSDSFSQEQIAPTEVPQQLEHILLHHKGNGLFSKFEEEKKIVILQRPLRSSGELIFLPEKGLYRKIIAPIQQELLLTMTAVRRRDHHGRIETLDLDKLPPAKALIAGFLAVFSGSWESIHAQFQVYFSAESHQWKLGLNPKDTMMSQMIACIIVEGEKRQVQRLWVREMSGDITRDHFSEAQILTPDQWKHYQWHFQWEH
jgi:hypothetical protein